MQSTHPGIHSQAMWLTETLGALSTSPSQSPASDVSLQCWRGTGIMRVFQSPLISCYKSTVDHCFYQLHLTDEETEAQKREVVYPKPHNSLPY